MPSHFLFAAGIAVRIRIWHCLAPPNRSISHSTPPRRDSVDRKMRTLRSHLLGLLLVGVLAITTAQVNVTEVLAKYPSYSRFNSLLSETGVISEVNSRSSLTILLPPDALVDAYVAAHRSYTTQMLADMVRYHVLLQYLDMAELRTLQINGGIVTTLFQTTGRANGLDGFVNITLQPSGSVAVGPSTAGTPPQASILGNVTQYPYNYSFFQIDAVVQPLGLAPAQLAPTTPPSVAPVPAPVPAVAPVPATAPVPAVGPVPVPSPVPTSPVLAPVLAPTPAVTPVPPPVPSVETPVPTPSTSTPVTSPPAPPMNGPTANEPPVVETPVSAPSNSAAFYTAHFSFAAMVASLVVAAAFLSL